jgi:SulP family sulfate permease
MSPFSPYKLVYLMQFLSNIKGDFSGAISAAIIMLPMSIGYGIIAYSPLGAEFAPYAALLGIYSAVLCSFVAALLGGTLIQISGPKAPLTLALGAVVANLVFDPDAVGAIHPDPAVIITLASLTVMLAGISQVVFGVFGLGSIVKYVPQPVVARFMNGIAILLITKQLKPLMGLDNSVSFVEILSDPGLVQGATLIVGLVTIMAIVLAKLYIKKVPASVFGLGIGTGLYYLLPSVGEAIALGNAIGHLQTGWPTPYLVSQLLTRFENIDLYAILPQLIISGLVIGLIGSMESLLSSVVADNLTSLRHNSKRELIGQGAGNIACAIFGALPSAGSIPRTLANYRAGGRTRLSGILCSLVIFLTITFCGSLIGKIPLAVIAGIIIVVGYTLFNKWSFSLIRKVFSSDEHRRAALTNLSLTAVVTAITISINLIAAVVIGIVISSALFISKVGKSIVRRHYSGDQVHSRKMRNKVHAEMLEKMGRQISVVELQGPLFFGSAEHLATKIDKLLKNSPSYFILDMKRVNEIDSTGANIILRIKKRVELAKKFFLLSNLRENRSLWGFLEAMNVTQTLNMNNIFPDTDSAMEWAEDHLLQNLCCNQKAAGEVPLSQVDLLQNLSATELATFNKNLVSLKFNRDDKIIAEGDKSRDLYLLKNGSVTVKIHLPEKNCDKRLYTYSSGIVFGEIAFLDGGCRSAGIWAHEDTEVLRLPYENFQRLQAEQPEMATKLVCNIAIQLSQRMRRISNQMRLLEDQ